MVQNNNKLTLGKSNKTLKRFRSALNLFEPISNTQQPHLNGQDDNLAVTTAQNLPCSPIKSNSKSRAHSDKQQQLINVPKINLTSNQQQVESSNQSSKQINGSINLLELPGSTSESKMLQIARQRRPSASNQTTINVNQQALFSAVERNQLDRARSILSSKSANVNSFSGDKLTCLDIAVLLRNSRMVRLLQQFGAKESSAFLSAEQRAHQLRSLYLEARQLVEDLSRSLSGRQSPSSQINSQSSNFEPDPSQLSNALIEEKNRQLQYWRRRLEFFMRMRYEFERLKPPIEPELVVLEVTGERCLSLKIVHSMRVSKQQQQQTDIQSTYVRPNSSLLMMQPLLLSSEPWPSMTKCKCPLEPSAWFHPRKLTPQLIPTGSSYNRAAPASHKVELGGDKNDYAIECDSSAKQEHERKVKQFDKLISDQFRRRFNELNGNLISMQTTTTTNLRAAQSFRLKRQATSCAAYKRRFSRCEQQQYYYAIKAAKFPLNQQSLAYRLLSGQFNSSNNNKLVYDSYDSNKLQVATAGAAAASTELGANLQSSALQNAFDSFEFEDVQDCDTSELDDEFDYQHNQQLQASQTHGKASSAANANTKDHALDNELGSGCDAIITKYLVQWSEDANFRNVNSMIVYKNSAQMLECRIGSLVSGRAYFVRVAAGNHKGYSDWRYATPPHLMPSSWRQVEGTRRRRLDELVLSKFTQLIVLNKHILNTDTNQYSSGLLNPLSQQQHQSKIGSGSKKGRNKVRSNRSGSGGNINPATTDNAEEIEPASDQKSIINMILQDHGSTGQTSQQLLASLCSGTGDDHVNHTQQNGPTSNITIETPAIDLLTNRSSSNYQPQSQSSSASSSVRKNLKSFFQSNSFKFHKLSNQNKRGLYLTTIIYHTDHDSSQTQSAASKSSNLLQVPAESQAASKQYQSSGRIIVTNDERLPVIEILNELISPATLLSDFYWLLKISGTRWIDIKRLRQQLQKSHSSSTLHLRIKLLLAIEQMQLALNLEDIGRLFYKPIQSHDGSMVICTCRQATNPKLISSLSIKWISQNKIIPRHLRKISDSLLQAAQAEQQHQQQQHLTVQQARQSSSSIASSNDGSVVSTKNYQQQHQQQNQSTSQSNNSYYCDTCLRNPKLMSNQRPANSNANSPSSSHNSLTTSHISVNTQQQQHLSTHSCDSSNSSLASASSHINYEEQQSISNNLNYNGGNCPRSIKCSSCGKVTLPPTMLTTQATNSPSSNQQASPGQFSSNTLGLHNSNANNNNNPRLSTSSAVFPSAQNRSGSMYLAAASASAHFTSRHSQPIGLGVGVVPQRTSQYLMLASLTIYDLLLYTLDEMIHFDRNSNNKLKRGLYLGFLQLSATIESMRLLVPRSNPNMLPCARIRDNSHVSKEEWQLLSDLLLVNRPKKPASNESRPGQGSADCDANCHKQQQFNRPISSQDRAKSVSPSRFITSNNQVRAPTLANQNQGKTNFSTSATRFNSNLNASTNCVLSHNLISASSENLSFKCSANATQLRSNLSSSSNQLICEDASKDNASNKRKSSVGKTSETIYLRANRTNSVGCAAINSINADAKALAQAKLINNQPEITRTATSSPTKSTSSVETCNHKSFKTDNTTDSHWYAPETKPNNILEVTEHDKQSPHLNDVNSPQCTFVRQLSRAGRKLIDTLTSSLPRQYDVQLDDMVSILATLNEPEFNRIYHLELIELSGGISFILLIPSAENICPVTTQENSNHTILSTNHDYMFLPMQFFETLHLGTYEPELLAKYSRLSVTLETELTVALHDHRQAFSSSELKNTKSRVSNLQEMVSITEDFWRQMRWLTEVVSFGRDRGLKQSQAGLRIGFIWNYIDCPEAFSRFRQVQRQSRRIKTLNCKSHELQQLKSEPNKQQVVDQVPIEEPKVDCIISDRNKPINLTLLRGISRDDKQQSDAATVATSDTSFICSEQIIESQLLDSPEAYHISLNSFDLQQQLFGLQDPFDTRFAEVALQTLVSPTHSCNTRNAYQRQRDANQTTTNPFLRESFED